MIYLGSLKRKSWREGIFLANYRVSNQFPCLSLSGLLLFSLTCPFRFPLERLRSRCFPSSFVILSQQAKDLPLIRWVGSVTALAIEGEILRSAQNDKGGAE